MTLRYIGRYDSQQRLLRMFRMVWNIGNVGDGEGYSNQFTLAFCKAWYRCTFVRQYQGWFLNMFGVRFHYQRSKGGIFGA